MSLEISQHELEEVEEEHIDSALAEWSTLGFSTESLDVLKHRLHGRVFCRPFKGWKLARYEGFDSLRSIHIIQIHKILKEVGRSDREHREHEIRHSAILEIFRTLLDMDGELYEGMEAEDVKKKVLNAYECFISPFKMRGRSTDGPSFKYLPEKVKEGWKLICDMEKYDQNKFETITGNKGSITNALDYLFGWRDPSLCESICGTEQEVAKYNFRKKLALISFFTPLNIITGYYWVNYETYGDLKARRRLRENIQNIKDPYEQFLRFITTK